MDQSQTSPQAGKGQDPTLVLKIIYGYMIVINIALPLIVFFIFPPAEGQVRSFAPADMFPSDFTTIYAVVYGLGLLCFVCGFTIPKMIGRKGSTAIVSMMASGRVDEKNTLAQAVAPYMIRLVLFETTTLCGFVVAFLSERPEYILPLGTLGLLGALISPPTSNFIKSMTE